MIYNLIVSHKFPYSSLWLCCTRSEVPKKDCVISDIALLSLFHFLSLSLSVHMYKYIYIAGMVVRVSKKHKQIISGWNQNTWRKFRHSWTFPTTNSTCTAKQMNMNLLQTQKYSKTTWPLKYHNKLNSFDSQYIYRYLTVKRNWYDWIMKH
jgi:hypothetical protein